MTQFDRTGTPPFEQINSIQRGSTEDISMAKAVFTELWHVFRSLQIPASVPLSAMLGTPACDKRAAKNRLSWQTTLRSTIEAPFLYLFPLKWRGAVSCAPFSGCTGPSGAMITKRWPSPNRRTTALVSFRWVSLLPAVALLIFKTRRITARLFSAESRQTPVF